MVEEEFKKNGKLSDNFLQKIRDIGIVTEYAPQRMIWWRLPSASEDCPKITEDLSKIKTVGDLYHAMERLKAFDDKYLPQDFWKCPIVMHTFIPKNRD